MATCVPVDETPRPYAVRAVDRVLDVLDDMGLTDQAVFVSRCGWPEQEVVRDVRSLRGRSIDYFSLLIIRTRR